MSIQFTPYLSFKDNAREAMEYYHSIFGGDLRVSTFKELGGSQDPSEDDLVMHSVLEGENGITIMASDIPSRMPYQPGTNDFSLSLSGEAGDEERLRIYFDKLQQGGNVTMPLQKAVWGDTFGMLVDRYGITWLVNVAAAQSQQRSEAA
jgi:PhnB protein